jgi:ribosomal protein L15E
MEDQKHNVCKKCDKYLLVSDFYKNKRVCKKCLSEQKKILYQRKKGEFSEKNRERYAKKKEEIEGLKQLLLDLNVIAYN